MSNKNNKPSIFNELNDSLGVGAVGVSNASMIKAKQQPVCDIDLVEDSEAQANEKALNSESEGKIRRRSALIEDGQSTQVKQVGYEQRNSRLTEQGEVDQSLGENRRDEFNQLLAKGIYLLGMREHGVQELTDKLNARSESADVVLAVIDELLENGYLSDERFTESYIRSRTNRGFGPIKIKSELKSKGITGRLIGEFLDGGSAHWFDVARELYDKKYTSERAKDYKEWTKRARFIQSRGFTMEHIQAVMPSADFY